MYINVYITTATHSILALEKYQTLICNDTKLSSAFLQLPIDIFIVYTLYSFLLSLAFYHI